MLKKLQQFWGKIPPRDRKLIKWTAIASQMVVALSLILLLVIAPEEPAQQVSADSLSDSLTEASLDLPEVDSNILPPPVPDDGFMAGLDSFDNSAHKELARIYFTQHHYGKSLMHAERIAPWMEDDIEFQKQLAQTYLNTGKPVDAIPILEKALTQSPHNIQLISDLALAHHQTKQSQQALDILNSELEMQSDPLLATTRLQILSETSPREKTFDQEFQKLLRAYPQYAQAHYQYGRYLMNQGNFASSLQQLQKTVQLDPLDPKAHARLGMAFFYLGKDQNAEKAYKTALALNPRDYNTWFNLGELHLSLANESDRPSVFIRRTRQALESYLSSLAYEPDHPKAHYRVGSLLNFNHQNREAVRHLEIALQGEPKSVPVLLQLAIAWEQLNDPAKAWDYLQEAYQLDPFNQVLAAQWKRLQQKNQDS